MEFYIVVFWIAFSILVGVFAHVRRNRSGIAWFILALILSPVIAGALVAILREEDTGYRLSPLDPLWTPEVTEATMPRSRNALLGFLLLFGLLWLIANSFQII
jgi:hypothetical protein